MTVHTVTSAQRDERLIFSRETTSLNVWTPAQRLDVAAIRTTRAGVVR